MSNRDSTRSLPPLGPSMKRDVAALTNAAVKTLFPPFAAVPAARRHTMLWHVGDVEVWHGHGAPDLVLGDCLIELKTQRTRPVPGIAGRPAPAGSSSAPRPL